MTKSSKQKHSFSRWTCQHSAKILFLILFIVGKTLLAQTTSEKARFEVDYIIGCAPLTVTVTDLDAVTTNGTPAPILVDFHRDSSDLTSLPVNSMVPRGMIDTTYTEPGTYLIAQVNGNAPAGDLFDYLRVTVLPANIPPIYNVSFCANNAITIHIEYNSDPYDGYVIEFGDGQDTIIDKSNSPPSINYSYNTQGDYEITVSGRLDSGYYNTCENASQSVTTINSLPTPSIHSLKVVDDTTLHIMYDTLQINISYRLEVDDGNGFTSLTPINPANNPASFTYGTPVLDFSNQLYTLRLVSFENCGAVTAVSNEIPSVKLNDTSAYVDNHIDISLQWETSGTGLSGLSIIENGAEVQTPNTALDTTVFPITQCTEVATYEIQASFGSATSTSITLTPNVVGTLTPPTPEAPTVQFIGGRLTLNLTAPITGTPTYHILRRGTNGNFVQIGTTTSGQFIDQAPTTLDRTACYQIHYLDECGNTSEVSGETCITLSSDRVIVPTAFTPNGDDRNNEFRIADGIYPNFQLFIYNRSGILVFTTTNPQEGWDGYYQGKLSPIGTYIYRFTYEDSQNTPIVRTGSFLLIR